MTLPFYTDWYIQVVFFLFWNINSTLNLKNKGNDFVNIQSYKKKSELKYYAISCMAENTIDGNN